MVHTDVSNLEERTKVLVLHMRRNGYSGEYVRQLVTDIRWLERNGSGYDSYADACVARQGETKSKKMRKRHRVTFGIVRRYVEEAVLPDRRRRGQLFRHDAYESLCDAFRAVVDAYLGSPEAGRLKPRTAKGYSFCGASFLKAMQEAGRTSLEEVTEEDVLSYFTGDDGLPSLSGSTRKSVKAFLTADLGDATGQAARIASLLPGTRSRRRNVDFLKSEETASVRSALSDEGSPLCARDRAIATLLYHTGIRPVDVVGMRLRDIDWEAEEIRVTQSKTGAPLVLPLTPEVGNAIYDYLESGRPESPDDHVFLSLVEPYDPLGSSALYHVASRVYDAAGVRGGEGDRRGTHLFRYNVATTMVGSGVPLPVASSVLGHRDPTSIDAYLFADVAHLAECALDPSRFPVAEGVFDV